jgi:phosphoglucomutase
MYVPVQSLLPVAVLCCGMKMAATIINMSTTAQEAIPYFKGGLKGVARSMPTSTALGKVAEALGIEAHEARRRFLSFLVPLAGCSLVLSEA